MLRSMSRRLGLLLLGVILLTPASQAASREPVLTRGADFWHTATAATFTSFDSNPIPAGFFCPRSKPFTGRIGLEGKPLATEPAHVLGNIDTIVRRLDDAVLNEKGEATTRIQLMALSLASRSPLETECGRYDVTASLAGEQPMTEMKILRTSQNGGSYVAPLRLKVKIVFTPVLGEKGERRELTNEIRLGPGSQSVWAFQNPEKRWTRVRVDTNGDGVPDQALPGPSTFATGMAPAGWTEESSFQCQCGTGTTCHCSLTSTNPLEPSSGCASSHLHCVQYCKPTPCSTEVEP